MAKQPKPSLPADAYPGDFLTRFVTLKKCKSFSGGNYELIGGERVADRWSHLVKSQSGQSDWFEHAVVMAALTGYWNVAQETTDPTEPVVAPQTHQVEADESATQHTLDV